MDKHLRWVKYPIFLVKIP